MSNKNVLVKFQSDYADEFDIYGFKVFESEESFFTILKAMFELDGKFVHRFGTNEEIEFSSFDELSSAFEISIIDDFESALLLKLFPPFGARIYASWGSFPDLRC